MGVRGIESQCRALCREGSSRGCQSIEVGVVEVGSQANCGQQQGFGLLALGQIGRVLRLSSFVGGIVATSRLEQRHQVLRLR